MQAQAWLITGGLKRTIAWIASIIIVAIVAAYLLVNTALLYNREAAKYVFVSFFLAVSISHMFIFPRWFPYLDDIRSFTRMLLLSSAVSICLLVVFMLLSFDGGMLPFAAGAACMLPYTCYVCWQYFLSLHPVPLYAAWFIPVDMQPETKMSLLLNSFPFVIKIKLREKDMEEMAFTVTLTGKLQLANMFCRFLYDHNGMIEVSNQQAQPYGWFFYVRRWYGLKALDPHKSLIENGIGEQDVLIVRRDVI